MMARREPSSHPPCHTIRVENVVFSVDTVKNRLLVLLEERTQATQLPGTRLHLGEALEACAYRSLAEHLDTQTLYLEQLYTFDGHTIGDAPSTSVSVCYFALVPHAQHLQPVQPPLNWYDVHQLPTMAKNHAQIVAYGHQRLCSKLEYSPIAFDVLPPKFTLNELYQFYGTVLGDNFADYSNFRTRLLKLGFLVDSGTKVSSGAGRPASLYQFDAQAFAPLRNKPFVFV